jgi:phosphoribosylamine--glycine ligase
MGAYAPLPWAPAGLAEDMMDRVIGPAVDAMARLGTPYRGLLYAGLALTAAGPKVVEFNARFGDPETQVVLDRLASPLGPLLHAAAIGELAGVARPEWRPGAAVVVVIAAEGYPEAPAKGDKIFLAERAVVPAADESESAAQSAAQSADQPAAQSAAQSNEPRVSPCSNQVNPGVHHIEDGAGDAYVLHAGTAIDADGELVSAGGRVLNVVGSGADVAAARRAAYELAGTVEMRGGWYRRDIAAGR